MARRSARLSTTDNGGPRSPEAYPDRIRCLECGHWFKTLNLHLLRVHRVSSDDCKRKHGVEFVVADAVRAATSRRQTHLKGRGCMFAKGCPAPGLSTDSPSSLDAFRLPSAFPACQAVFVHLGRARSGGFPLSMDSDLATFMS